MKQAQYNNANVNVIAVNGGWTTIELDGVEKKVRNSHIGWIDAKRVPRETAPVAAVEAAVEAVAAVAKVGNVIHADLNLYVTTDIRTASGRKTLDCGDATAANLRGKSLSELYTLAANHRGVDEMSLMAKYMHLNPGMQRMNLGNLLRKAATTYNLRESAKTLEAYAMENYEAGGHWVVETFSEQEYDQYMKDAGGSLTKAKRALKKFWKMTEERSNEIVNA